MVKGSLRRGQGSSGLPTTINLRSAAGMGTGKHRRDSKAGEGGAVLRKGGVQSHDSSERHEGKVLK